MDTQTNQQSNQSGQTSGQPQPVAPAMSAEQNKTLMGVLSYLGILVIIPYLTSKHDEFVKFHIKQGLVLACIEIVVWVLSSMFWSMWMVINIVNLGTLILSIIGIINVLHRQQKELPVVGHLSKYFNNI